MKFKFLTRRKWTFSLLTLCFLAGGARADDAPLVNGAPGDVVAVGKLVGMLEQTVEARDPNTLQLFGVGDDWQQYTDLKAQTRITHMAVTDAGALVRQDFRISGTMAGTPASIAAGTQELWLSRLPGGRFAFTPKHWTAPLDAAAALAQAAREEWQAPGDDKAQTAPAGLLHLVAERRGDRWIALRRSRWNGILFEPDQLVQAAQVMNAADPADISDWLRLQMKGFDGRGAGRAHFFLQAGRRGWVGLGSVWDGNRNLADAIEKQVAAMRVNLEGAGYFLPAAHRDFGVALSQIGLTSEAADELAKADAMQPGLIGAGQIEQIVAKRNNDPQNLAITQLQNEAKVGLDSNHPVYTINALMKERPQPQTPLRALRLGLEYSKLADDEQAGKYLHLAEQMVNRGGLNAATPGDVGWAEVIVDHLREREKLLRLKPPNIVRSALFTLRCYPNDLNALQVLAALESAQHTVYADFGIPMGSTEVIVWRTQSEFQRYTSMFTAQGNSEFVAALTLTKLISTQDGPLVLGEEVNVFTDPRANTFSTLAHEYGHVAVRQLSRGRVVPVWFNEGIATAVEGGYDGYLPRVRKAATARRLLLWPDIAQWNVDGERAFLAYSQANSVVDYMIARWGRDAVLEVLRQIGRDVASESAFRNVLKISQSDLWSQWAREGIR